MSANNGKQKKMDPFAGSPVLKRAAPDSLRGGTAVVWFRNDVRVRDHQPLKVANFADVIVPVYVFDTNQIGGHNVSPHGFQRVGPFRAQFLKESVRDLRNSLRWKGSDLIVKVGDPVQEIESVVNILLDNNFAPLQFLAHKEVTKEEVDMERAVEEKLNEIAESRDTTIEVHWYWGATLHHVDDLPFNPKGPALPKTFTDYRKLIEGDRGADVRPEITMPDRFKPFPLALFMKSGDLPSLGEDLNVHGLAEPHDYPFPDYRAVMTFEGGITTGEERIQDYIWDKHGLEVYKETRNNSGTKDFSSKFSPWLALGCLSPRTIYWNCKRFEEQELANESTYWMVFELMTRDYFRWVAASVHTKLFALNGYSGRGQHEGNIWTLPDGVIKPHHQERLQKWIQGMTGAPYVDASMRELANTGFMSNRGRQNVASFLIHDLEFPDWRAGAEYFESVLIDYDVASNWANWAYIAGVGSDPRGGRRFNVVKQSMTYDPDGWYIKRWCPELVLVEPPMIHEPHLMPDVEMAACEIVRGETYAAPIVKLPRGSTSARAPSHST